MTALNEGSPSETNNSVLQIADLALDLTTGDLYFPPKIIYGIDAVAQRIRVRFKWFLGEWFLDKRQGIPYYRDVLIKNPDPVLMSAIFRQVLSTTPGVKTVISLNATIDKPLRKLLIDFQASLIDGGVLTSEAEPFILE